jgi:hypothetical protein
LKNALIYEVLASLDKFELKIGVETPKADVLSGCATTVAGLNICQPGSCLSFAKLIELPELEVKAKLIVNDFNAFQRLLRALIGLR